MIGKYDNAWSSRVLMWGLVECSEYVDVFSRHVFLLVAFSIALLDDVL